MTHLAHLRNLQQNMLRTDMTLLLHSTPVKISSRPILTSLNVLVNSLELITSLSEKMLSLWYIHPENIWSLCNPWYVRNVMRSSTKVLLFQLKNLLIGSLHLPTHGKLMGNYESVWTQRILIQLLDMITTKSLLWQGSPMNWQEAHVSSSWMEPNPSCA